MSRPTTRRPVRLPSRARRPAAARNPLRSFRPQLEPLESRWMPYAVTEIAIPLAFSNPRHLAAAAGNRWFTEAFYDI